MRIGFFGDSLTSGMPGSSYVDMLRQRFPEHTLLNFGKPNDTVVSLYRRVSAMRLDQPLDLAFQWIGVNDVLRTDSWWYRAFHALIGQRRAKDLDEFRSYHRGTLQLLCDQAGRVIVAPPALKGENLANQWNRRLVGLSALICELAAECDTAHFLDLRAAFARELARQHGSDHLPRNPFPVLDVLTLRTDTQVDVKAAERGLHLTLDGVHLNSAGARLVAEEFEAVIRSHGSQVG